MVRWFAAAFLSLCSPFGHAQHQVNFSDYSVPVMFHGKPAEPLHNTPNSKTFRTKIRQAVASGANFADHYTLVLWGCGAGCVMFSIVDAVDGRVFDSPFTVSWFDETEEGVRYVRDSRAIHIVGSLIEGGNSADRWYAWNGEELKLLSEKPARHLTSQQ
jgi:hypothetical protein